MSNVTQSVDTSQLQLAHALVSLKAWQDKQDAIGANRHGLCLLATRAAVESVGLVLPPPQPKPNNVALWCGQELVKDPARYGWRRVTAPFPRYTLDFYSQCGQLPDGRIAGHIAVCDHQLRTLFSSTNYVADAWWVQRRFASFVPL